MPDATLSEAIQEAYASADVRDIEYHTLELYHPAFSVPIRVVLDTADLTATLEAAAPRDAGLPVTFVGFAFGIVPPDVIPNSWPTCAIEIDNVTRDILVELDAAMVSTDVLTVIYRVFLSSDLAGGPQNNPPLEMTINSVSANVFRIRANAGFGDLPNRRFPGQDYTSEVYPGLIPQ